MSEEPTVLAALKAGTTIVAKRFDGLVVSHPDDLLTLIRWDGTRETIAPDAYIEVDEIARQEAQELLNRWNSEFLKAFPALPCGSKDS